MSLVLGILGITNRYKKKYYFFPDKFSEPNKPDDFVGFYFVASITSSIQNKYRISTKILLILRPITTMMLGLIDNYHF